MAGKSRVALRLELLNDRVVPSVTVVQTGSTLYLTGDQSDDTVRIQDDGTDTGLLLNGTAIELTEPVTRIVVDTRGGNDTVSYTLADGLTSINREVNVFLGNGSDTFTADLDAGVPTDSTLTLTVNGGNGKDTLSATGAGAITGNLNLELIGGNGKDAIDFSFTGGLTGSLTVIADGGNGNDTVAGEVTATAAEDTGSATIEVRGGNGKDNLSLAVEGEALAVDASIDPGRGKDVIDATDNVEIITHGKKKK